MRSAAVFAIGSLLFCRAAASGQVADADAREELAKIEHELAAAWKAGNCEAWAAHIAPEWTIIHISGEVLGKKQVMEMCEAPPVPIETLKSDELDVRSYGDTAVVRGRTIATTGGPAPQRVTLRFTDVFVPRDGRWLAVASQATQVMP